MSEQCRATVRDGKYRCRCRRKAVHDGYCKQHHQDAVAARHKASDERYNAQRAEQDAKYKAEKRRRQLAENAEKLIARCSTPTDPMKFVMGYEEIVAALLDGVEEGD